MDNQNAPGIAGTVTLISGGGPVMSVKEMAGDNVRCTWFNKEGNVTEHVFGYNQLRDWHMPDNLCRLISGGPIMSVIERNATETKCIWFDKEGHVFERGFPNWVLIYHFHVNIESEW